MNKTLRNMILPPMNEMPEGWKVIKGATHHPKGYIWINNGKSLFDKDYKQALLLVQDKC